MAGEIRHQPGHCNGKYLNAPQLTYRDDIKGRANNRQQSCAEIVRCTSDPGPRDLKEASNASRDEASRNQVGTRLSIQIKCSSGNGQNRSDDPGDAGQCVLETEYECQKQRDAVVREEEGRDVVLVLFVERPYIRSEEVSEVRSKSSACA